MVLKCSNIYVSIQYRDPQLGQIIKIFSNSLNVTRFDVLMAVTIKSTIFWNGSLVDVYQRLESKSKPSKQAVLGSLLASLIL